MRAVVATAILLALAPGAWAGSDRRSLELYAKIFFKLATYDANLPPASQPVRVGVFFDANAEAGAVAAVFKPLESVTLLGRRVLVEVVPFRSIKQVSEFSAHAKPYALFFDCELDAPALAGIRALSTGGILTFSTRAAHVEAGVIASVEVADNKPRIVINVRAASAAGRQLSGSLLQIARVVK